MRRNLLSASSGDSVKLRTRAPCDFTNRLPQFVTDLDGLRIHFVHMRSREQNAMPLLLAHGWPGSFAQFAELIPRLTDPARWGSTESDAFDVVLPSLPGFFFSDPFPTCGPRGRIADLWHELIVKALGYSNFAAAGGDIGSDIVTRLALQHPESLRGIHLTDVRDPWIGPGMTPFTMAEQSYRATCDRWYAVEGGYDHIQATKPHAHDGIRTQRLAPRSDGMDFGKIARLVRLRRRSGAVLLTRPDRHAPDAFSRHRFTRDVDRSLL
jgi:pimeloyl-ACP methyl ester carboxylesterase